MLAEVTDLCVVPEVPFTFLKLNDACKDFKERRFACAIWTYKNGSFATLDGKIEARVNPGGPVGHVNSFQGDRTLASSRWLGNLKSEWFARSHGFLDEFHSLNLLELAHG